ncbi:hypothetical protein HUT06_09045 [Actinomadura sp. NAK00032]|uniref:MarR family winged helix-turn-helix transcriptional regulator n=1 Tax=Actinomadura sp. NAK00032 TaxID=2742128 RepID=UPI00158FE1DD|nr:hypothetical protein [Actinomadura sp. NAK00032]QKW34149.1 hypothetical protein HUT06_09045 [Actinomadura sp. NAK00032]
MIFLGLSAEARGGLRQGRRQGRDVLPLEHPAALEHAAADEDGVDVADVRRQDDRGDGVAGRRDAERVGVQEQDVGPLAGGQRAASAWPGPTWMLDQCREARGDVDVAAATWRRDGLAEPLVAMLEVSKRAGRVAMLVQQAMRPALAGLGLTDAEFEVLTVLRREGALTRSAFLTSGGTGNVLQRLQKAGHIAREANAGDSRSRFVQLTEDGLRVTERGLAAAAAAHEDVMGRVSERDVRAAADALREIVAAVRPAR